MPFGQIEHRSEAVKKAGAWVDAPAPFDATGWQCNRGDTAALLALNSSFENLEYGSRDEL